MERGTSVVLAEPSTGRKRSRVRHVEVSTISRVWALQGSNLASSDVGCAPIAGVKR